MRISDNGGVTRPLLHRPRRGALRLHVLVILPRTTETTALGPAYLAGLAVGFWKNREEIERLWGIEKPFRPRASRVGMKKLQAAWHSAVERSKGWSK